MRNTPARIANRSVLFFPVVVLLTLFALVPVAADGVTEEGVALPVTAVNLFTSGVGYFQHDGTVEGTEEITLTFSTGDVNDLLKSLVLQDFDGGTVEAVTYPSQDPLSRILGAFSIDVSDNPDLAELVNRARGAEVHVSGPVSVTGTVSGVEYRDRRTDSGTEEEAVLNLLTQDGLRQLLLNDMETIRFTDPGLQGELEAALRVIAENRDEDRKSVTIRFAGDGERGVRIGYVRAVPVWKTSYRLVLAGDGEAQIQGWAIVENTGEKDWDDVSLGLVSEQPISFVMDLYSPIYRTRPEVQPDAGVAVAPQQYERDVAPLASRSLSRAPQPAEMESYGFAGDASREEPEALDLSRGVASAAVSEGAAVYRVDHPISLQRRGAALIPIVATSVQAEPVSIYDRSVLANRPLRAIRLANDTGLQLPAGPATIFDGANYAGDARLPEMIPGEDRLVSYAVDLGTTVVVRSSSEPETITAIRIVDGVLEVRTRDRVHTDYVLERLGDDDALHVIVHPKRSGFELAGDLSPTGETSDSFRFEVDVASGETGTLTVTEERPRSQQFVLTNIQDDRIAYYLSRDAIDDRTARRLERIRTLRSDLAERERTRRETEQSIEDIFREQERIRSNVEVLESGSDLYRRYLETLASQEEQLEALREELATAREREAEARSALRAYIESL